jgi:predicted  nucleic acid-binding Zn-ribbon protein
MSETSSLKFKTAYDEAKSTITASLDAVKTTYDTINRDLSDEVKAIEKDRKELTASLGKANKEIDALKATVSGLEISLASSKELAFATQKSLEVRTR